MTGRNWDRERDRSRVARRGAETIDGAGVRHGPPAARKPKEKLRAEIEASTTPGVTVAKLLVCCCGHRGTVRVPIAKLGRAKFRCQRCKELTP
ncbi:MAG: hypothetical protein J0I79_14875 [Mesorhizobium sp.]|uniref:hypothetical protein n=1 Tax=Mesorhizobium sp. TaxID=1871066 RepID=UPI001ACE8169|nr:hypothetical protein [Mesorhizobium sp.]MBN9219233.1 hypothetical protein [Mesorhizobium sp.]